MRRKRYFLEYLFVRSAAAIINFFPIAVSTWIARRIGDLIFWIIPGRRKIALANLEIAFADSKSLAQKKALARECFRHLVTCLVEFFRLPKFKKISPRHVRFQGSDHLDAAFAKGRGAILAMSHLGPWEYLGFLTYLKKIPTTILGRPIRNPYFYRWIISLRKLLNLQYSDKIVHTSPRQMLAELRQNHLVAIVIDQWAGSDGLKTEFFNRTTSTTSLPGRLAQKTGAPVIPAYCIRSGCGEYEIHIQPEVKIAQSGNNWAGEMTAKLNHLLEEQIRSYPGQWMWTHRRWKPQKGPGPF